MCLDCRPPLVSGQIATILTYGKKKESQQVAKEEKKLKKLIQPHFVTPSLHSATSSLLDPVVVVVLVHSSVLAIKTRRKRVVARKEVEMNCGWISKGRKLKLNCIPE